MTEIINACAKLDHQIVSSAVTLTAPVGFGGNFYNTIDLDIPDGYVVTGSGLIVEQLKGYGTLATVDSQPAPQVAQFIVAVDYWSGPSTTAGDTKWRFQVVAQGGPFVVRPWISVIGTAA